MSGFFGNEANDAFANLQTASLVKMINDLNGVYSQLAQVLANTDLSATVDGMAKLRDDLVRARDRLGVMTTPQSSPNQALMANDDAQTALAALRDAVQHIDLSGFTAPQLDEVVNALQQLVGSEQYTGVVSGLEASRAKLQAAARAAAAGQQAPPKVNEVYGDAGGQMVVDAVNNVINQVAKQSDQLKALAMQSPGTALDAQVLRNKLERLGAKNRWLTADATDLRKLAVHNAGVASGVAKLMAVADVDSGTMSKMIGDMRKLRAAVEQSNKALSAGNDSQTAGQLDESARALQLLLGDMTTSLQQAGDNMVRIISNEQAHAKANPMTDAEIDTVLQQRMLKNVKLQQPLSQTTTHLLDAMYADSRGALSGSTWRVADHALRVGTTLATADMGQSKTQVGFAGDFARLTALEIKSATMTRDVARSVLMDMNSSVNGRERIAMGNALRDDVLKQMQTLAGIISAKAVNVDPDDKDLKELRALHEDLREVANGLNQAVEQNTLKNIGNSVLSGMSSTFGFVSAGLGLMGLGGLLDLASYARGGFSTDVTFGKAFYDTALVDASFGASFSRNAAEANLARGRELFNLSYGMVDPTYTMSMRNAILRGAGGRRSVSADQALADADVLAQMLSGASIVGGVDQQEIIDYARNMMYDNNRPPEEVIGKVFAAMNAAKEAGVPVKRYFTAINGLISRTRELGMSADEATGTMTALMESGMRVEDAAELTHTAARVRNNVFGGSLGNANAIVFGSMMGLNNDRPWVNALIGNMTHDANLNPITGRHALLGSMLRQQYSFYLNAVGNDSAGMATFNNMLRSDGFTGMQASQLTAMLMRGGIDDEKLGTVLEGFEGQKEMDREAVVQAAQDMDKQLAKASDQLGATSKIESHRQRLMQDLAVMIENDFAPMLNMVNTAIDEAMTMLTRVAKWVLEYAGELLGDGEGNMLSEGAFDLAGDAVETAADHPGVMAGAMVGVPLMKSLLPSLGKFATSSAGKKVLETAGRNKYALLAALAVGGVLAAGKASAGALSDDVGDVDDDNVVRAVEGQQARSRLAGRQSNAAAHNENIARLNSEYEQMFNAEQSKSERELVDKQKQGEKQLLDAYKQLGGDLTQIDSKQRAVISAMVELLKKGLISKRQAIQRLAAMANGQQTTFAVDGGKEVYLDEDTRKELYSEADAQIRGSAPYDAAYYRMITAEHMIDKIIKREKQEEGDAEWLRNYKLVAAYYALQRGERGDGTAFTDDDMDKLLGSFASGDVKNGWTPDRAMLNEQLNLAENGAGDDALDVGALTKSLSTSKLSKDQLIAMRKSELRAQAERLADDKDMVNALIYNRFKVKEQEAAEAKAKEQRDTFTRNPSIGQGPGAYENVPYIEWRQAIDAAAAKYGVDKRLIAAIAQAESDWDPQAQSQAGARGLMQIMPETAEGMGYSADALYNPLTAIDAGARYIRSVADQLGTTDPALIAAGYNAGPGAVQEHGGIPNYTETQQYVRKVLAGIGTGGAPGTMAHAPGAGGQTPLQQQEERGPLSERIARASREFGGVVARGKLIDNMRTMALDSTPYAARRTLTVGVDQRISHAAAEWATRQKQDLALLEANDRANRASASMAANQATSILEQEQAKRDNDIRKAAETTEDVNENKDDVLKVTIAANVPQDKVTFMAKKIQEELAKLKNMGSVDLNFQEMEA